MFDRTNSRNFLPPSTLSSQRPRPSHRFLSKFYLGVLCALCASHVFSASVSQCSTENFKYVWLALGWAIVTCQSIHAQVKDAVPTASETVEIQLFTAPDESSPPVGSVGRHQIFSPMAESLGAGGAKWHLVKTKSGIVGWMKANDTDESKTLERFFKSLPPGATVFNPTAVSSAPPGARPRGTVEVPIDARGSLAIVPVTFNGTVTAYLALDTGAARTLISRRIANNLALYSFTSGRFSGIGGTVTASVARVESVKVGEAEVSNLVVAIHDFSQDPRFEGLLGLDFLRHFQVSLDPRKQLLTLIPR